jgi:hypothetical protein
MCEENTHTQKSKCNEKKIIKTKKRETRDISTKRIDCTRKKGGKMRRHQRMYATEYSRKLRSLAERDSVMLAYEDNSERNDSEGEEKEDPRMDK